MKVPTELFLFIVLANCQSYYEPLNRQVILRQGAIIDYPSVEKYLKMTNTPSLTDIVEPDLQTLLIPQEYKPGYPIKPVTSDNIKALRQADAFRPNQLFAAKNLADIDKEALSKLSDTDQQVLLSQLTQADRAALLAQFEQGRLVNPAIPTEESRFASGSAFAGAAAQIGAGAGSYIGGRLAGALGAKLGAAAGAYLAAAAASRFDKTAPVLDHGRRNSRQQRPNQLNYGAVLLSK